MERLSDWRLDPPELPTTFECDGCQVEWDSDNLHFCAGSCGCPLCSECYGENGGLCDSCYQAEMVESPEELEAEG